MANGDTELIRRWEERRFSDKPVTMVELEGLLSSEAEEAAALRGAAPNRLELARRGRPTGTWTDALSGLYVNRGERGTELKNILDDYMRTGGIDEESMAWLEGLPRREKGWLYGKRGPTEATLAGLKEDLIWEAAAVRAARQRDLERETAKQTEEPQKATRE